MVLGCLLCTTMPKREIYSSGWCPHIPGTWQEVTCIAPGRTISMSTAGCAWWMTIVGRNEEQTAKTHRRGDVWKHASNYVTTSQQDILFECFALWLVSQFLYLPTTVADDTHDCTGKVQCETIIIVAGDEWCVVCYTYSVGHRIQKGFGMIRPK